MERVTKAPKPPPKKMKIVLMVGGQEIEFKEPDAEARKAGK